MLVLIIKFSKYGQHLQFRAREMDPQVGACYTSVRTDWSSDAQDPHINQWVW